MKAKKSPAKLLAKKSAPKKATPKTIKAPAKTATKPVARKAESVQPPSRPMAAKTPLKNNSLKSKAVLEPKVYNGAKTAPQWAERMADFGGIGQLPWAPGTWGSLVALPFWFAVIYFGGIVGLITGIVALFLWGWAAVRVLEHGGKLHDSGSIVVDEVVGQGIALIPFGMFPLQQYGLTQDTALWFAISFILFRILDVVKPFPIGWIDRDWHAPVAVMLDDVLAGLWAALLGFLLFFTLGSWLMCMLNMSCFGYARELWHFAGQSYLTHVVAVTILASVLPYAVRKLRR
ncbi:MAG: phosphatidylglycerophosphatase A [Alphaproteobacteria bacterium]